MTRELTRREMQVLGFLERHEGEVFTAGRIACAVDMAETQANETLRRLTGMGYVDERRLTDAGRKMLWPHCPSPVRAS